MKENLKAFEVASEGIVTAARGIKVLSALSWPKQVAEDFLDRWHRGNPRLPDVSYATQDMGDTIRTLMAIDESVDRDHPLGRYLSETARSYATVARMLEHLGSPEMTEYSVRLYGRPGDPLPGAGKVCNIEAAQHFIDVTAEYMKETILHDDDYCLSAEILQGEMSARLDEVFDEHKVAVVIDPDMASKAAAGATRIRLRSGVCFSEYDLEQLLQHEAFVHSLTALNGRQQTRLTALGLGAPRTTGVQEGLATFSELVTGCIDISRMERISQRIIAIDMALGGADFIEVFRWFLDAGQTERESFNATMRVFRGAPLTGGSAFTKDAVYLHGLMAVHTFFRWCLRNQRLRLCRHIFAGRMTIGDVIALEPYFESGWIDEPRYLPPWMTRANGLAGYLAFAVFANKIRINALDEGELVDRSIGEAITGDI